MHDAESVLAILDLAASRVRQCLDAHDAWGRGDGHPGQYALDVAADAAALDVLIDRGFAVFSEESGFSEDGRELTVVVDPVDGSTNASLGLPWYSSSMCVVDGRGMWVSMVINLVTGQRFSAVRGEGAVIDRVRPPREVDVERAIIGVNGRGPVDPAVWQVRTLGSAALELCAVASGQLDGWVDLTSEGLAPWDYMGALLVLQESGAAVVERFDRDLVVVGHGARRLIAAGRSPELLDLANSSWRYDASEQQARS